MQGILYTVEIADTQEDMSLWGVSTIPIEITYTQNLAVRVKNS